jgi:hypothetical protein
MTITETARLAGSSVDKDNIYKTPQQLEVKHRLAHLFETGIGDTADRLESFAKFITRQDFSLLLARYDIFRQVLPVKGSVVECGVYYGNGLMTWAHLSAALEPTNYNRRILGFDTFSGNCGSSEKDVPGRDSLEGRLPQAAYVVDSEDELQRCISIHDGNRFLSHIPKVELIRGDICQTVPRYVEENPQLLVSLLSLSVNLYEPTKTALRHLLPRMSRGSIIALHTLNEAFYPGVTRALLEELELRDHALQTIAYAPNLGYIVL